MRSCVLGAVVALASLSQAILLPPVTSSAESDSDVVSSLPFEHEVEAEGRIIVIDCHDCPVAVPNLRGELQDLHRPSKLQFDLAIQHAQRDVLTLNGMQLYPLTFDPQSFFRPLTSPQIVDLGEDNWQQVSEPTVGYNLQAGHLAQDSNDQELALVSVKIDIFQVADAFLEDFPTLEIKLLETPSGRLMIGDLEILSQATAVAQPHEPACATLLCKWKAIAAEKLGQLQGHRCDHSAGDMSGPRPYRQGPHHFHRFRHHRSQLAHFLRILAAHVFVPILIGLMAGIIASLVGMIVGHLIVLIWRALFRRNSRNMARKCRHAARQASDFEGIDEKIMVVYEDGPPKYEELSDDDEAPLLVQEIVVEQSSQGADA